MTLMGTLTRGGGRLRASLLVALSFAIGACDGTDHLTNPPTRPLPASALPAAAPVALFASSSARRRHSVRACPTSPTKSSARSTPVRSATSTPTTWSESAGGPAGRRPGDRVVRRRRRTSTRTRTRASAWTSGRRSWIPTRRSISRPTSTTGPSSATTSWTSPHDPTNWGGTVVSPATVERDGPATASSCGPRMPTIIRCWPDFLKGFNWKYLDAAWAQYSERKGDIDRVRPEQRARRQGGRPGAGGRTQHARRRHQGERDPGQQQQQLCDEREPDHHLGQRAAERRLSLRLRRLEVRRPLPVAVGHPVGHPPPVAEGAAARQQLLRDVANPERSAAGQQSAAAGQQSTAATPTAAAATAAGDRSAGRAAAGDSATGGSTSGGRPRWCSRRWCSRRSASPRPTSGSASGQRADPGRVQLMTLTWSGASAAGWTCIGMGISGRRPRTTATTSTTGTPEGRTYTYKVCERGTSHCSNSATVSFE